MNLKRAFTLIELLVVIAIIAILAAILFPVFAQAKLAAKKTQTLSQFKQTGVASNIYLTDSDDVFPLAMSFNSAANSWRYNAYTAIPEGWTNTAARDVEPRKSQEGAVVFNSIQPYTKNVSVYEGAGLVDFDLGLVDSTLSSKAPAKVNLQYNGLLHGWSATAVNSPSKLPLMLENYKQNTIGAQISNPQLCCSDTNKVDCRFNPGGYPQGGQTSCAPYGAGYGYVFWLSTSPANFTTWVYGKGMAFIASDTSAKVVQFNAPNWPLYAQNVNSSPWSSFDPAGPAGSPYWMTDCVAPGGTKGGANIYYAGYFRPDSQYDYTLQQCDFGGG